METELSELSKIWTYSYYNQKTSRYWYWSLRVKVSKTNKSNKLKTAKKEIYINLSSYLKILTPKWCIQPNMDIQIWLVLLSLTCRQKKKQVKTFCTNKSDDTSNNSMNSKSISDMNLKAFFKQFQISSCQLHWISNAVGLPVLELLSLMQTK
jgi:hypothetical protein